MVKRRVCSPPISKGVEELCRRVTERYVDEREKKSGRISSSFRDWETLRGKKKTSRNQKVKTGAKS